MAWCSHDPKPVMLSWSDASHALMIRRRSCSHDLMPIYSILTSNNFSAAQISLSVTVLAFKLVFTTTPPTFSAVRVCVRQCACAFYWHCVNANLCMCVCVCTCAILCACVFAMFCMKMLIFVCFVRLYTTDLYNYGYLCIVCFFFKL